MLKSILVWLSKPFYNFRLRKKLFIMFLFVAILPLLFFVYYTNYSIRTELTNQTYSNVTATINQINSNLESKLDAYAQISTALYMDNTLRAYLIQNYAEDPMSSVDAYQYFNNVITSILTTNPDINSLSIYTNNTTLPLDRVFIKPLAEEFLQSKVYKTVSGTHGDIRFLTRSDETGTPPTLTLGRLLNYNSLNFPYGILTMNVLESDIYALMEKETTDKSIFIIDNQGIILSAKDKTMLNGSIDHYIPSGFTEAKEGRYDTSYNGEKALIVYNTTKYGWKTVSVIPYRNIIASAQAATQRSLTIALISIFLAALLIYVTTRLFTKRVEYLLKMIRRVDREDFNVEMKSLGHDEIGQLGFAFHNMSVRVDNLITEVYKKEIDKKEAEMDVLQSQINPHFLYNTLASISSLAIRYEDRRLHKMVSDLAKFYRISLNKGKKTVSISEEIKLTQYYIAIQQIRFEGLLRIHYDIEESVLPYPINKLTLQPFVENCINHAIWDMQHGINIILRAYRDGEDIVIKVIDDGMGMSCESKITEKEATSITSGYGILNVDQRIKLMYGASYGVTVFSRLGIGTTVQIRIPG